MMSPQAINNSGARQVKISMLISKPFALGDESIKKCNDKIASGAFQNIGYKKAPIPEIPKASMFKSNSAVLS